MEAVWQIVALGLLGAVLAALLKKHTPELALLLAVAVCGAAALAAVRGVREVWAFLEDLLAAVEISSTLFLPLLKTAGIAVVTRIGADRAGMPGRALWPRRWRWPGPWGRCWRCCP